MIAFQVNDMSCGHCVGAITQAVKGVDPGARIEVDLASHRVQIEPAGADGAALADAIREAGYTPEPVAAGG
ncbi:heavy-metal-associated domain-containing protein [Ideonella sp. DXS29W]|uniref:Heavy-metal-associated domain-containing protein n=1 Tax=Ideonella lacteola TaxID=2984193 RepID=A0ABU9BTS4_9BURK